VKAQESAKLKRGEMNMKYMLLISVKKDAFEAYSKWPKDILQKNITFMRNINKELKDEGVLVTTAGLAWPDQAVTVTAAKDGTPITDGIFPESKEFLAGYWIIDVESREEAYKVAARISLAPAPEELGTSMPLEVRELMTTAPDELFEG
jgi:hypothetical protein